MSNMETIDRLCTIINDLSDLCRKQAEIIAQSDVECPELLKRQGSIGRDMDIVEYNMRTPLRYGDITGFDDAEIIERGGDNG